MSLTYTGDMAGAEAALLEANRETDRAGVVLGRLTSELPETPSGKRALAKLLQQSVLSVHLLCLRLKQTCLGNKRCVLFGNQTIRPDRHYDSVAPRHYLRRWSRRINYQQDEGRGSLQDVSLTLSYDLNLSFLN